MICGQWQIKPFPNALPFDREKAIGKSYNYLKTPSRK
jgi:hypothetical protein